jgi:hypothetical protein
MTNNRLKQKITELSAISSALSLTQAPRTLVIRSGSKQTEIVLELQELELENSKARSVAPEQETDQIAPEQSHKPGRLILIRSATTSQIVEIAG